MKSKKGIFLFRVVFFIVIAYFSYKAPLLGDDLQNLRDVTTSERIKGLDGILKNTLYYYTNVEGRLFSYLIMHAFIRMPRVVWGIGNAMVVMILVHLIHKFAITTFDLTLDANKAIEQYYGGVEILLCLLLWFFCPALHDLLFWECGTIVYTWMNTFAILFCYLYYKEWLLFKAGIEEHHDGFFRSCAFFFVGLMAGGSVEATSCAMLFGVFVYFIAAIRNQKHISVSEIVGAVGCLIGCCVIFLAPGTYSRMEVIVTSNNSNIIYEYIWRLFRITYYSFISYLPLLGLIATLLYLNRSFGQQTSQEKRGSYTVMMRWGYGETIFVILYLVSTYVMLFSNGYSQRVLQIQQLFLMIALVIGIYRFLINYIRNNNEENVELLKRAILVFVFFAVLLWAIEAFTGFISTYNGRIFTIKKVYWYINEVELQGLMPGNGSV